MVAIEAFLGEFERTRTVAQKVHGSWIKKLTFDIFEQEQSWILLSFERVIREGPEGRRQRAVGTAEKSVTMSHHSVCVLWSEQTRRAGHGVCGEEEWSNGKIQGAL